MKSGVGYGLFLFLVFGCLYFGYLGQTVVIDYDEGIYAEVSHQMFKHNQLLIPTYNGEGFFEKPPMLYWGQILGYKLFGLNSLGARFFNSVAALAAVIVFYLGAIKPLGSRQAATATLIFGSSILTLYLGRIAMTDMILTFFLLCSMIIAWYGVERELEEKSGGNYLFWTGCLFAALAMLTKGVIGALFPLLAALLYLLSIGRITLLFRLNWLIPGAALIVVIGFSWYLLLGIFHPEGFSFMKELFVKHHLGRFSSTMEGHSGPFFYYAIVLLVGMLPWFGYLIPAAARWKRLRGATAEGRYLRLFFILSTVVFVFFSAAATKLPNYILPAVPGIALLISLAFSDNTIRMPRLWKGLGLVTGALFLLLGILLFVAPLVFPYIGGLLGENARKAPLLAEKISLGYQPFFAGMMIIAGGALLIFSTRKGNVTAIFGGLLGAALLLNAAVVLFIQPVYDRLADRPLIHMAVEAAKIVPEDKRILLYKIHQRPSVNFYSDRNSIRLSSRQVEEMPALFHSGEVLAGITTSYQFGKLKEAGLEPQKLAEDTGFILFNLPEKKVEPAAPAEPAMVEEKGVQQEGADVQPEKPSEQERGAEPLPVQGEDQH